MTRKLLSLCMLALPACAASSTTSSTSSNITAAVPKAEWLDIQTAAQTPVVEEAPSPAPPATCAGGPPAMFAAMSAQVMGGANSPLEGVLGIVGAVTQSPPVVMTPDHAVWGPLDPAGAPLVHKLDIQRVAPDVYHFLLSGRPAAGDESTWVGLFQGDVHSIDADHGEGDVEIDFAAIHSLDASSDPTSGQISIHFAAAPDARAIDETFAQITSSADPQPNNAHYVFNQDANGIVFDFATSTDFDHDGTTDEVVNVTARFAPDGSGKASTIVSGGGLGSAQVGALECWDNQQRTLFYADDMNANPPAGDPGCCVM